MRDDLSDAAARAVALAEMKKRNADFPARLSPSTQYAGGVRQWQKTRGALDDTTDLKRMLRGSGVLEYHILVQPGEVPQDQSPRWKTASSRMAPARCFKAATRRDGSQVDIPRKFKGGGHIVGSYRNRTYVLAWITPDKSLDHREGQKQWALTSAAPQSDRRTGE